VAGRERVYLGRFYCPTIQSIDEATREHYAAFYAMPTTKI
jgi:hypothetical protein